MMDEAQSGAAGLRWPRFDELGLPREISPLAGQVAQHGAAWARATGLAADDRAVARLREHQALVCGSLLIPRASLEQGRLVSDWTIFLIVLDDEFDEGPLGSDPARAQAVIAGLLGAGAEPGAGAGGALGQAWADLRGRAGRLAPDAAWAGWFGDRAREHIASKVTEARHRAGGQVLDVTAYTALRRITGASYSYAALAELTEGAAVSAALRATGEWAALHEAFADVWTGIQDICLCAKEVGSGDDLNLIAVLGHARRAGLQAGIDWTAAWLGQRLRDLDGAGQALTARYVQLGAGTTARAGLRRYLAALRLLLGGHLAWHVEDNPRFGRAPAVAGTAGTAAEPVR
jgi:(+)-beta-caryophyllene/(+)-caryolan-1-ol synthase